MRIHGINTDEIEDSYALTAEGSWHCRLTDVERGESKAGNDMLIAHWETAEGPSKGTKPRTWMPLEPDDALVNLKRFLEAFGHSGEIDVDTNDLIGQYALLTFVHGTYEDDNGKEKPTSNVDMVEMASPEWRDRQEKKDSGKKGKGKGKKKDKGKGKKKGDELPF